MVPADLVVLDTNEIIMKEAVCYIDTHLLDGKTDLTLKKASSLTQSTKSLVKIFFSVFGNSTKKKPSKK